MHTLAIDNETRLITRFRPAPKVICTSFYGGLTPIPQIIVGLKLPDFWEGLLTDIDLQLVGHNIAYDMCTIAATYPDLLPLIFEKYRNNLVTDTGIRQQIWDIAVGRALSDDRVQNYSLAGLARIIFDESMEGKKGTDIWRLRYSELENAPLHEWQQAAIDYATNDAKMTYRVWEAQNEVQDQIRYEHERAYAAFVLALIQNYGMRTNSEAVEVCRQAHEETQRELLPRLIEAGLIEVNKKGKATKKKKAARDRVIKACLEKDIDLPLTPTGKQRKRNDPMFTWRDEPKYVATDKVACFLSQDPLLKDLGKYANAEKMLSTYLPTLEAGVDGPIATRFGMAATGRTTSKTPGAPLVGNNFQNAPRDGGIRECFYPRPGRVFLAADFSGAELHTLAQTCKDRLGYSVLGDTLQAGRDAHLFMAGHLLDIDYDEAEARFKEGDEDVINARQDAKAANFGFPGGMMQYGFQIAQIKQRERFWEIEEITTLRDAWIRAYPEMDDYFDYCKGELGPQGKAVVEIPGSRMLRTVSGLPMCANTGFQGPAAAGALRALCEVSRRCYIDRDSALYGARPCNFIHDEIILEIRKEADLVLAAEELMQVMEDEFNRVTPDYPVSVEPVLMAFWSKRAKPVFDENGELTVWGAKEKS